MHDASRLNCLENEGGGGAAQQHHASIPQSAHRGTGIDPAFKPTQNGGKESATMRQSKIEWTESTWNPVTGCTKLSAGCVNCHAERMAKRLQAMGQPNYRNGFKVTCHPKALDLPLTWKRPQMVFVNSMSDLFHEAVPVRFIERVFATMNQARWHCFHMFKQWGGVRKKEAGRALNGRVWEEMPLVYCNGERGVMP